MGCIQSQKIGHTALIYVSHDRLGRIKCISDRPLQKCIKIDQTSPYYATIEQNISTLLVRDKTLVDPKMLPNSEKKVAMISTYGVSCGIATYTKYLCDAMRPLVKEIKIFSEVTDTPDAKLDEADNVVRCWERRVDYSKIVDLMFDYNPDVIFIQHEFGKFHNIGQWWSMVSQLSRWRTVTVLHTVLEHRVSHPEASDDYRTRALSEGVCGEIIVHSPKARETVRDRGYHGLVHHIPHGCLPPAKHNKLPSTKYEMFTNHSIFQYGFGSKHKGWEIAIDVVDKLKDKYPDIMYVGLYSLSSSGGKGQEDYYYNLLDKIRERRLENHVSLHKGFQSEAMLANFAKSCRVAMFPYQVPNSQWASWGASGAIRLPLSMSMPLVLSDFPQFSEFEGILPMCKSVDEFVATIDRIFCDKEYELGLQNKAREICESRSWSQVAQWYLMCNASQDFNAI